MSIPFYFEELWSRSDFYCYQLMVNDNRLPGENSDDPGNWYDQEEYQRLTKDGVIRGWWLKLSKDFIFKKENIPFYYKMRVGDPVGWCAVRLDAHYPLDPVGSIMLLGGVIFESYRGLGFAKYLWEHRINLYGHKPLTVCIRPGNLPSEKLAAKNGFEKIGFSDPYNWYLRNPK